MQHTPVLLKEVLQFINPQSDQNFIDCTLGLGGHAIAILEKTAPNGKLLAIEQNYDGLKQAKENLKKFDKRITFINDNFNNLKQIIKNQKFHNISGILLDLGLASWQIDEGKLGISFQKEEPLDMCLEKIKNPAGQRPLGRRQKSKIQNITAKDIVNKYPFKKLADIFYKYGDVRNSYAIARKIIQSRERKPIISTFQLAEVLQTKNPKILAPIFQALRIEVNQELGNLESVLPQAVEILKPNGKIVIISYHSGEDRIVKNFLRQNTDKLKILTKKPIAPSYEEISQNPRARSAKMRVGEKN